MNQSLDRMKHEGGLPLLVIVESALLRPLSFLLVIPRSFPLPLLCLLRLA